jgi:hypothetical protein
MSISINSRLQEDFQHHDGIFLPKDYEALSAVGQKQLWDKIELSQHLAAVSIR